MSTLKSNVWAFIKKWAIIDWIIAIICTISGNLIERILYKSTFKAFFNTDITSPIRTTTLSYPNLCAITFGIGGVVVFILWSFHSFDHRISWVLSHYYFSVGFTILISTLLKRYVGRPRPDTQTLCGGTGSFQDCIKVLSPELLQDQFYSFPSGHAAESMASAFYISLIINELLGNGPAWTVVFKFSPIFASLFIGVSRIVDRAHHVDDVVMGFIIGGVIAIYSYKSFNRMIEEEKFEIKRILQTESTTAASMSGYA